LHDERLFGLGGKMQNALFRQIGVGQCRYSGRDGILLSCIVLSQLRNELEGSKNRWLMCLAGNF